MICYGVRRGGDPSLGSPGSTSGLAPSCARIFSTRIGPCRLPVPPRADWRLGLYMTSHRLPGHRTCRPTPVVSNTPWPSVVVPPRGGVLPWRGEQLVWTGRNPPRRCGDSRCAPIPGWVGSSRLCRRSPQFHDRGTAGGSPTFVGIDPCHPGARLRKEDDRSDVARPTFPRARPALSPTIASTKPRERTATTTLMAPNLGLVGSSTNTKSL